MQKLVFELTLTSKTNLHKLYLFKLLTQHNSNLNIYVDKVRSHKNVFLDSPFHFKTVKSHLYIPTIRYTLLAENVGTVLFKPIGLRFSTTHVQKSSIKL